MQRVEWVSLISSVAIFGVIFELVRRRKMQLRYSLLWFCTWGVLVTLTVKRQWLEGVAREMGVYYPPSALFLMLNFFLISILIHLTTVVSELKSQTQKLAQEVALRRALERVEASGYERNDTHAA